MEGFKMMASFWIPHVQMPSFQGKPEGTITLTTSPKFYLTIPIKRYPFYFSFDFQLYCILYIRIQAFGSEACGRQAPRILPAGLQRLCLWGLEVLLMLQGEWIPVVAPTSSFVDSCCIVNCVTSLPPGRFWQVGVWL